MRYLFIGLTIFNAFLAVVGVIEAGYEYPLHPGLMLLRGILPTLAIVLAIECWSRVRRLMSW